MAISRTEGREEVSKNSNSNELINIEEETDVQIERGDDNTAEINITVDGAAIAREINNSYKETNKNIRVPGFRPGKAPRKVLDTHYTAEYFIEKSKDALINYVTPRVVDEHGLLPLGEASFDIPEEFEV